MSSSLYDTNLFGSYNNSVNQGKIDSWKGVGIYSFQSGNMAKDTRPYWNKDYTNDTQGAFGKPRPLKHFRKARVIPQFINIQSPEDSSQYIEIDLNEPRIVRSAVLNNMTTQMNWIPGGYSIVPNSPTEIGNFEKSVKDCVNCNATTVVSNWKPTANLTEKPEPNTQSRMLCCNDEYKARRRVRPPSTLTQRNYYVNNKQYLQNRCITFNQRQFNFIRGTQLSPEIVNSILNTVIANPENIQKLISTAKPGSPLSYFNIYVAQCVPNGQILEATIITIISSLILGLRVADIISSDEYDLLVSMNFTSFEAFINFYKTNFPETQANAIGNYVFLVIDSNKTLSEILEGPTGSTGLGCQKTYYKPNNSQFATQGGVMASLRTLQLNVNTIEKNYWQNKNNFDINNSNNVKSNNCNNKKKCFG